MLTIQPHKWHTRFLLMNWITKSPKNEIKMHLLKGCRQLTYGEICIGLIFVNVTCTPLSKPRMKKITNVFEQANHRITIPVNFYLIVNPRGYFDIKKSTEKWKIRMNIVNNIQHYTGYHYTKLICKSDSHFLQRRFSRWY